MRRRLLGNLFRVSLVSVTLAAVLILSGMSLIIDPSLNMVASADPGLSRDVIDSPPLNLERCVCDSPPSPPMPIPDSLGSLPEPSIEEGTSTIPNVPALEWAYGCSPTSAAMMFGYYDRTGYGNMYAGPTNGGLFPLPTDNTWWGAATEPGSSIECPLSATHQGVDGLATNGHVDDYWAGYGHSGDDPFVGGGWPEHTHADCTADFMWTSQDAATNSDGGTTFWNDAAGEKLSASTLISMGHPYNKGGLVGVTDFAVSRGYTVTESYNQYILNSYKGNTTNGFTWDEFTAQIDAGRPVMIHAGDGYGGGHSMLAYGYDEDDPSTPQKMYIHNTWDYGDHEMPWGGLYSVYTHYGVTVLELDPLSGGPGVVTSCDLSGNSKDYFLPGEGVCVTASGLDGNTTYDIWIQDNPVGNGDTLIASENPSILTPMMVTTTSGGYLPPTLIWDIPSGATPTGDNWDIILDKHDADQGCYNEAGDGIDSATMAGFTAPTPELPTIALFGLGLAGLLGFVGLRRAGSRKASM